MHVLQARTFSARLLPERNSEVVARSGSGVFLPLSCRMVGSSRRPFSLQAVHHRATTCISSRPAMRVGGRTLPHLLCATIIVSLRLAVRVPPLPNLVCLCIVLFAQTQNDLLRSTIFHISSLWCRALVLYGSVSKLMQEALTALHTTIPFLYQHGDFGAFLVDIDWHKHCQGPIGVHFCYQLLRFFHARHENPLLGAVETPARVCSTLTLHPSCWRVSRGGG